jgi:hypothetical protein
VASHCKRGRPSEMQPVAVVALGALVFLALFSVLICSSCEGGSCA